MNDKISTQKCTYCNQSKILNFYKTKLPLDSLPISKKEKNKLLIEKNKSLFYIKTLHYKYCMNCGLIFSDISTEESKTINLFYRRFHNQVSPLINNIAITEINDYIENLNPFLPKIKNLLEIGCFDGYLLYELKKRGIKVLGIDPSGVGAKIAKGHKIKVINDFFTSSIFNKKKFDAIISRNVIEHVKHPFDFLKEQIKILNKSGFISFETPDADWLILKGNGEAFHSQHQILFTKKFIIRLLKDLDIKYAYIKELDHRIIIMFSLYCLDKLVPLCSLKEKIEIESLELKNKLMAFQEKVDTKANIIKQLLFKYYKKHKIAIWGAGSFTGNLLSRVEGLSKVEYIVDSDPKKQYMQFLHSKIPIVSSRYFYKNSTNVLFIFSQFADEIITQIQQKNFSNKPKYIYRFFPKFQMIKQK